MTLLDVQVFKDLDIERDANLASKDQYYSVTQSSMFGANLHCFFKDQIDTIIDKNFMKADHKPYLLQVTMLVESPMKLYILNQNHSKVIFGS
jgi:hypothetical protein